MLGLYMPAGMGSVKLVLQPRTKGRLYEVKDIY